MNSTWESLLTYFEDWQAGDLSFTDISELEYPNWEFLKDEFIVDKLKANADFRYEFWRFLQFLIHNIVNTNLFNVSTLTIHLSILLLQSSDLSSRTARLTSRFWLLFTQCKRSNTIKYDRGKQTFTIGNTIQWIFSVEAIPKDYRFKILHFFDPSHIDNTKSLTGNSSSDSYTSRLKRLLSCCKPGDDYKLFEEISANAFAVLFPKNLGIPKLQARTENGLEIRDAIFPIENFEGRFWELAKQVHSSGFLIVEAKNYNQDLTQVQVLQVVNYLNNAIGNIGIIWTRGEISDGAWEKQRSAYSASGSDKKLVLLLKDKDVIDMFELLDEALDPSQVLNRLYNEFCMSFHP